MAVRVRRHAMSCNLIREGGCGVRARVSLGLGVDLLNPKRLAHFKLQNAQALQFESSARLMLECALSVSASSELAIPFVLMPFYQMVPPHATNVMIKSF
jgi:hypothetical protein